MENASKALLIAGAILLVIALIAIGMAILGQGENTVNDVAGEMDQLAVQAANQKVTPYLNRTLSVNDYEKLKSGASMLNIDITTAYITGMSATANYGTNGVITSITLQIPGSSGVTVSASI